MLFINLLNVLSPSCSLVELREDIGKYDTTYIGEASLSFFKTERFQDFHNREVIRLSHYSDDTVTKWIVTLKAI